MCVNGTCENPLKAAGTVCSASRCYENATCDGVVETCPALVMSVDGTPCAPDDHNDNCLSESMGNCLSGTCIPAPLPDGTACLPASSPRICEKISGNCQSGVCVHDLRVNALCNMSVDVCSDDSFCDGVSPTCPPKQTSADGSFCPAQTVTAGTLLVRKPATSSPNPPQTASRPASPNANQVYARTSYSTELFVILPVSCARVMQNATESLTTVPTSPIWRTARFVWRNQARINATAIRLEPVRAGCV